MSNGPVPAFSSAGVQFLRSPGQVMFPLPQDVLASAPWIFVVYLAFQAQWPPVAIIVLVAALVPVATLPGRPSVREVA